MKKRFTRGYLLLSAALCLPSLAETEFVSGVSDGLRTYAVIRRNGQEFRTDQMGQQYNQHLWDELSDADRLIVVRAYGWDLNRRRDHFNKTGSDAMAGHYNDVTGWTATVDALKERRMAKDYPDLKAMFGPGTVLTLPDVSSAYAEVRDSYAYRRAAVIAEEARQDFEIGQKLYQTLTSVKWEQVSVAVKGISGPLIKIIVDNFMTGFITHGSQPMSELVVAMRSFKNDLESFLKDRENPGSTPPTPGDLIARIEKMLDEIERMADLATANVTAKRSMLESLAMTINEMEDQIREARQARGTVCVEACENQVAATPAPGSLTFIREGESPYEEWQSMNRQCMAKYHQIMAEAEGLQGALDSEKGDILRAYASAGFGIPFPLQVWDYFPDIQSRFTDSYADLAVPSKVATPWADKELYARTSRSLSRTSGRLYAVSDEAEIFLRSAVLRINALHVPASALNAYQHWMGSWDAVNKEPIPATWTTLALFEAKDMRNLAASVIPVVATPAQLTADAADDFTRAARFLEPVAEAFSVGLDRRKVWLQKEGNDYASLRFNFENSLSYVVAALTQFDRLHQPPEFVLENTVEMYREEGKDYPVVIYRVDIPYLQAQINAQKTAEKKQNMRLRTLQNLYAAREQELILERRLEIAQNAHLADFLDLANWRRAFLGRYDGANIDGITDDFKRETGQTMMSHHELYRNLVGANPTFYYVLVRDEPRWIRSIERCRAGNLRTAIQKISGQTDAYYELLDLYNDMWANQSRYLAMSDRAFNAFMTDTTLKIGSFPQGTLITRLQNEGVWGIDYPAWRLLIKTQDRQEALNTRYRGSVSQQVVADNGVAAHVTLPALPRHPGINGRLTSEAGSPLAGVIVRLSGQLTEWTTTASDGSYAFDFLPNGTFVVTPPDGFVFSPATQTVIFAGTEKTADFVLPDNSVNGVALAGRITDSIGAGVRGVRVQVATEAGVFVADVVTGAQGDFNLSGLAAATYTVRPLDDTRLFHPTMRTLQLPPSAAEVSFQVLAQPAMRRLRASGPLAFGEVGVGGSAVNMLRLHNDGNAAMRVESVLCPSGFSGAWQGVLAPGATHDVLITFAPAARSAYAGAVTVFAESMTSTVAVACSGVGVAAPATLVIDPLTFGPVTVGSVATRSLRLRNHGDCYAVVTGMTLPTGFGSVWSGVVAAGGTVDVPVTFTPTALVPYAGTITAALSGGGSATAACTGEGVTERVPVAWLTARGLPADGSADFSDPDDDGASVFQEWLAGSDPTDTSLDPARVSENQPAGTVIGAFVKPYADPAATYTYTLAAGAGDTDNAFFTVSGDTLKTTAPCDYETKARYTIRVRRTDQTGLWYETPLAVAVDDVNEAPADIGLSSTSVPEQRPRGTAVGEFTASDPDAIDFFTYAFATGPGDTDNGAFVIKDGTLQTASLVTYAVKNSYSIRVCVTDRGDLAYEKAFTLTVVDPGSFRNLIVRSVHGGDTIVWTNRYPASTTVRVAMTNTPVEEAGRQFICSGWRGSGSTPSAGATCDTGPFALAADSTVMWQWRTNVWLAAAALPGGAVSGTSGWHRVGAPVTLTATPDASHTFVSWSGDTNGCAIAGRTVTATMSQPRALIARFQSTGVPQLEVTFNPQGGAVATPSKSVASGLAYGTLPDPTRSGFTFDGWWTGPGGTGTRVLVTMIVTASASHTLYAKWVSSGGGDDDAPDGEPLETAGSFDGYFQAAEDFDGETATAIKGTLALKVSKVEGKLTAKALLLGGNLSFSAKAWDEVTDNGTCYVKLTSRSGEALDLFVRQNRVWGTLVGGKAGDAPLTLDGGRNRFADRSDAAATALLEGFKGYYTIALPTCAGDSLGEAEAAPAGVGYLAVTVGTKGSTKVAGLLADGTKVSRAGRLILVEGEGLDACVPLFAPLYAKKGWAGGLLWLNPVARTVTTERDVGWFIRWEKPGKGPDGFHMLLDACGGFYDKVPTLAAGYLFTAEADEVAYHYAGGVAAPMGAPEGVPVTAAGSRMTVAKSLKPKKITLDGVTEYVFDEVNPAQATLAFAARTGIFKGKFTLWYEYEMKGKPTLKGVKTPYTGILTPVRDPVFDDRPVGMGHCLVPDTDPAFKALRLKRSYPVLLEATP